MAIYIHVLLRANNWWGDYQIQKNIISERGLGMPREPKVTIEV